MTPAKQRVVDKPQSEKVRRGSSITKPPCLDITAATHVLGADRLVREDGHSETEAAIFLRGIATCVSSFSIIFEYIYLRVTGEWFRITRVISSLAPPQLDQTGHSSCALRYLA